MRIAKVLLVAFFLAISAPGFADPAAEREAEKLLDTMGMRDAFTQTISQMLEVQIQQQPELAPYRGVMVEFFNRHMSYDSVKPDLLSIYANAFTASELREINAFYATPTGRKTIELLPVLMAQGGQIGMNRVTANMGELEAMIQAESERWRKSGR